MVVGLRVPEAKVRLEPASRLVQDGKFGQRQGDGLAIFSVVAYHYCVPLEFEELLVFTDRFHMKTLLPALRGHGEFYMLALSQNETRPLQCTCHSVGEGDLKGAPASRAEALRFDDPERRLQYHTASGPSRGKSSRPAMLYVRGATCWDQRIADLRMACRGYLWS